MRKIFLLLSALLLISLGLSAQNYFTNWVQQYQAGFLGYENIATDSQSNIYVAGFFKKSVDFDPGVGVYTLTADSVDAFLLKLDSAGKFKWAHAFGAKGVDIIYALMNDKDGNIIVAGDFEDTVDFDPSPATDIHIGNGKKNIFIAKFNASGNLLWAKHLESKESITVRQFGVNSENVIFITGSYRDTTDFDPDAGSYILGDTASYILSLKADGSFNFCKKIAHDATSSAISCLKIDKEDNIIIGGGLSIFGRMDLDPSSADYIVSGTGSFIAYYSPEGNFKRALFFQGAYDLSYSKNIRIQDYVLDDANAIYITGNFYGMPDFDIGADSFIMDANVYGDAFAMKYDSSGKFVWAKSYGGSGYDNGLSICLDKSANVYINGEFYDWANFGTDAMPYYAMGFGDRDLFILSADSSGNFRWVKAMGGDAFDYAGKMIIDGDDNLVQSGKFQHTIYFDTFGYYYLNSPIIDGEYFLHKLKNTPLRLRETTADCDLQIFPNPTNGVMYIRCPKGQLRALKIRDVLGRLIYTVTDYFQPDIMLDLNSLHLRGQYFVEMRLDQGEIVTRSVVFD